MHYQAIQLNEEFSKLNDLWSPKLIGEMNDYQFKIVKIAGDFEWHVHEETDKLFFVLEGEMVIDFRDGQVKISRVRCILCLKESRSSLPLKRNVISC